MPSQIKTRSTIKVGRTDDNELVLVIDGEYKYISPDAAEELARVLRDAADIVRRAVPPPNIVYMEQRRLM